MNLETHCFILSFERTIDATCTSRARPRLRLLHSRRRRRWQVRVHPLRDAALRPRQARRHCSRVGGQVREQGRSSGARTLPIHLRQPVTNVPRGFVCEDRSSCHVRLSHFIKVDAAIFSGPASAPSAPLELASLVPRRGTADGSGSVRVHAVADVDGCVSIRSTASASRGCVEAQGVQAKGCVVSSSILRRSRGGARRLSAAPFISRVNGEWRSRSA